MALSALVVALMPLIPLWQWALPKIHSRFYILDQILTILRGLSFLLGVPNGPGQISLTKIKAMFALKGH